MTSVFTFVVHLIFGTHLPTNNSWIHRREKLFWIYTEILWVTVKKHPYPQRDGRNGKLVAEQWVGSRTWGSCCGIPVLGRPLGGLQKYFVQRRRRLRSSFSGGKVGWGEMCGVAVRVLCRFMKMAEKRGLAFRECQGCRHENQRFKLNQIKITHHNLTFHVKF